MGEKVVIIGGGTAGINILESIYKINPKVELTLIKREKIASFSTCGIPHSLMGVYKLEDNILNDSAFYRDKGIDFRTETEVTAISTDGNCIEIGDERIHYDYLVIATGRKPRIPKIEGVDLERVYTVNDEIDAAKIIAAMNDPRSRNAMVIGGGTIGLQTSVAFAKNGMNTTIIVGHSYVLSSVLDPDMSELVEEKLNEIGVRIIKNASIGSINGKEKVESVTVNGEDIPAELVVISRGARPNVDLARKAGIEIGELGGIITDCKLHVKKEKGGEYLENVYALGDCVEVIDWVTKRPTLSMLASTGIAQSRIIADNLFGGRNCVFNPCLSPIATAVSDLQIGSIGVRFEIAKKFGIIPITGKRSKFTRVRYYPRRKPLTVKLLFDGERKLIGAQVVSGECVADRLSEYSVAIRKGITAEELLSIERCFEPSLSLHVDATVDAVRDAMKKM